MSNTFHRLAVVFLASAALALPCCNPENKVADAPAGPKKRDDRAPTPGQPDQPAVIVGKFLSPDLKGKGGEPNDPNTAFSASFLLEAYGSREYVEVFDRLSGRPAWSVLFRPSSELTGVEGRPEEARSRRREAVCKHVALSANGERLVATVTCHHRDNPGGQSFERYHDEIRVFQSPAKFSHVLKGHTKKIVAIAISTDGERLASAALDGTIRIWDLDSGKEILSRAEEIEDTLTTRLVFSPDRKRLAVFGHTSKKPVKIIDLNTDQVLLTLHDLSCSGVAFSPDNKHLATVANELTVWDIAAKTSVRTIKSVKAGFTFDGQSKVAYSGDARFVAVSGFDNRDNKRHGAVRLLKGANLEDVALLKPEKLYERPFSLFSFTSDSKQLIAWPGYVWNLDPAAKLEFKPTAALTTDLPNLVWLEGHWRARFPPFKEGDPLPVVKWKDKSSDLDPNIQITHHTFSTTFKGRTYVAIAVVAPTKTKFNVEHTIQKLRGKATVTIEKQYELDGMTGYDLKIVYDDKGTWLAKCLLTNNRVEIETDFGKRLIDEPRAYIFEVGAAKATWDDEMIRAFFDSFRVVR